MAGRDKGKKGMLGGKGHEIERLEVKENGRWGGSV